MPAEKILSRIAQDFGNGINLECHGPFHMTGRAAYKATGLEAFRLENNLCGSGYVHGAIEEYLKHTGTDDFEDKVNDVCKNYSSLNSRKNCYHGFGHGVMLNKNYDLIEALNLCDELDSEDKKNSCYQGVFMENIIGSINHGISHTSHKSHWVSSDPYYPCTSQNLSDAKKEDCFYYQASWMLQLNGNNFKDASVLCENAPIGNSNCFTNIGQEAVYSFPGNPAASIQICLISKEYKYDCIRGLIHTTINSLGEKVKYEPFNLCKELKNDAEKSFCYGYTGIKLSEIFEDDTNKIKELCGLSETEFIPRCLSGGQTGI